MGDNGLMAALKKRVVKKALAEELTHHLVWERGEAGRGGQSAQRV